MLRELRIIRIFRYVMLLSIFTVLLSFPASITIKPAESAPADDSLIDVLILSGDDTYSSADAVRTYLSAFADLETVDIHHLNLTVSIPTLSTLLPYEAVLVYSNMGGFDSVALGDLLADYVDSGGGVVEATFLWQGEQVQGRFLAESYGPFTSAGWGYYSWANLGSHDSDHPIMNNTSAISGYFRDEVDLTSGAELIASWSDGAEFVAIKGSVVGITLFPGLGWGNDWTGDAAMLFHNALVLVGARAIKVAFLPGWGSITSLSLIYMDLMNNWFLYGSYKLVFIEVGKPVTYEKLNATDADIVLICNPAGGAVEYAQSEADAIQTFLEQNATGIFVSYLLSYGSTNNSMLAPLVGVNGSALKSTYISHNNEYDLYQPDNPIFANMTDPWNSGGYFNSQNLTVPSWHDAILDGAQIVAETTDSKAAVVAYQRFLWNGIWVTSMVDLGGNEMDKQFVYNSIAWLALPARVVIDDAFVTDTRIDVSASAQVGFHAKWSHNGSSITKGIIYVNGTEHSLNTTGWISFPVTYDTVGKRTWTVTRANCSYITGYNQTVANPEITWDKVQVTLSITDNHINVGDSASLVVETATYQYDGAPFTGTVTFNDTLTKNIVRKYRYTVGSISDPTNGITVFDSNSVDCIFDKATITLSASHYRTGVGSKADVKWTAVYQYPNVEDYDGFIELNDTLTKSDVGEYTYTVSRIGGDTYNITAFQSNTVKVIFTLDTDEDGMPDSWETDNGLNPLDAADASLDPDGDDMTNLEEYQGGTDPNVSDAAAFPWLTIGLIAVVVIGIVVAVVFLLKRRK